ncbi:MAG TPA: YraN family protein [Deltaproteobacteria bacterium]|nr:YraN family protein [Deltaproteobacteria bacterium]
MCARSSRDKGAGGEEIAREYLKKKGYKVLDVNYHFGRAGEIDIIALDHDTVVFVEVKSASGTLFGDPLSWIPFWKQQRIIRVSQAYMSRHRLNGSPARFDVVAIDHKGRVDHVEDAFRPPDGVFV